MGNPEYKKKSDVDPIERQPWWLSINGSPVDPVPLEKSREVRLESPLRSKVRENYQKKSDYQKDTMSRSELREERQRARSSRQKQDRNTGNFYGGLLNRGIQVHRLWFQYLKLALELESLGKTVEIVTKSHSNNVTNLKLPDIPDHLRYERSLFRTKTTQRVKVDRKKYKGWDLDQVLNDPFNTWWKTHSELFEGYAPEFFSEGEKRNDDRFLYLKLDKTLNYKDVTEFIRIEVQHQVGQTPKFQIENHPRPDVCQNGYNALVLVLKGWTAPEICNHKNIYLRATDERSLDKDGNPSDRLQPSFVATTDKKTKAIIGGNVLYGKLVSQQRDIGMKHLLRVMEGRFGQ